MASLVNPQLEAETWLASKASRMEAYPTLIFLGLGSGYQIAEAVRRHPASCFIVIEEVCALKTAVQQIHNFSNGQVNLLSTNEFLLDPLGLVSDALRRPYQIYEIASSYSCNKHLYDEVKKSLTARDAVSLALILNRRNQQSSLSQALSLIKGQAEVDFTSFKGLIKLESRLPLTANQKVALRIFGEMVL
jgi:hypothetical protein